MIKAQRGTKDIMGLDVAKFRYIEDTARNVFKMANYEELRTPIFEDTKLFARGIGDSTDIVNKEMYTFFAPNNEENSITLRPENTAGAVRAYIEHGMSRMSPPQKIWYFGPMFRYERPQAGRQRQFHQVGVEMFGSKEATADAEVILLAQNFLKNLGLKNLTVELNSLGCPECRAKYKENIKEVLGKYLDELCDDCHVRYEKNPLRMLDCKCEQCQQVFAREEIQKVILADFICDECQEHFNQLKKYLDKLDVKYSQNKLLVRGLDYYNRTVFEIKSENLGSQNAVCGGGRYDGLVEMLGGEKTPAVGWAMGVERLMAIMSDLEKEKLDYFVVSTNTEEAIKLTQKLRENGKSADFDFSSRKFAKQFEKASKIAKCAVVIGEDEIANNYYTVKDLTSGTQEKRSFEELL
ncbi:MAG: histidine--tRNA ligase [Cyanobacteria bacterium SIG30]|nr:histidine--tRNA ligase [Cyanobacteria bacterium SIG30]